MAKGDGCKPTNKGNGKWQVRWCAGYDGAGKKLMRRETIQLDPNKTVESQYKEACKYRDRVALKMEEGRLTAAKGIALNQYAKEWLDSYCVRKGLRPDTVADYKSMLSARILPKLGRLKLRDVKPMDLNKFLVYLQQEGLSGTTQRKYFNLIHLILGTAMREQRIAVNPSDNIEPPKKDTKERPTYNVDQASLLVEALNNYAPTKWRTYALLALASAMRRGEMVGLDWADVDWEQKTITVNKAAAYTTETGQYLSEPKTKRSKRTIKLDSATFDALRAWKREQNERRLKLGSMWSSEEDGKDAIFTKDTGGRMFVQSPTQWFTGFVQKYDLPPINLHGMRHTSASLLLAGKCSVVDVSKRLGHSRVSTTLDIYAHAYAEADSGLADMMGAVMYASKKRSTI